MLWPPGTAGRRMQAFTWGLEFLDDKWGEVVAWSDAVNNPARAAMYSRAMKRKGCLVPNCAGLLDCTLHTVCRPVRGQVRPATVPPHAPRPSLPAVCACASDATAACPHAAAAADAACAACLSAVHDRRRQSTACADQSLHGFTLVCIVCDSCCSATS